MANTYFVYILASGRNGTLYIGVTNELVRRVWEHREGLVPGFTKRYDVKMLVYYEQFQNIGFAIHRETRLKMEASVETGIDRERESGLERFVRRAGVLIH